ncbi:ATP-grasp domain-containing protein [Streptantibioticus silvisoli]|uniref:ATP-grasp domain-containing protein n=1 Tax=Streptantibioticus silvisoli TaxID=2705255 RepID=A0ABT6VZX2_9ACTN|nr:ATP-grasp domain-containing protein [Streptantibioticus silvisoli]MDI5963272.1 ATP-grasp domain-containing protein [Streptantibioticus silvisoli]
MTPSTDVLIFSKRFIGGVRTVAQILTESGRRPVLVSDEPADVNRDACAAHIVVDWDADDLEQLVKAVDAAGVVPSAVVNFVEPLIGWQIRVTRHYGLPGGEAGREILLSKAKVREEMRRLGLSGVRFAAGPVGSLDARCVTGYPVIVKPAQDSGSSRLVRRADDAAQLDAHLREIGESAGAGLHVIVEQYVEGTEFSMDGPVTAGRFHALLVVEKTEHDERRHHDAGLRITPPPSEHVRRGAQELAGRITALCGGSEITSGWLHVEGRAARDGSVELIEINPRPGGGLHRAATIRTCGVDPIHASVLMALGVDEPMDGAAGLADRTRSDELLALLPFEADRTGVLVSATPLDELKRIPGVVDGYQFENFRVTSMDQENFFTETLITADSVEGLSEVARRVEAAFTFTFE